MIRFFFVPLFALYLALVPGAARAQKAEPLSYYGVYLRDNKLGYVITLRDAKANREGRPAVRVETTMRLSLKVQEQETRIFSRTVSWNDPKTGVPLAIENRTESGGSVTSISAVYTPTSVSYVADITGTVKKETLKLAPGEKFLADVLSGNALPKVGAKYRGKIFLADPGLLKLIDSEIEVAGREMVEIGGQMVTAFRVLDQNPVALTTLYLNDAGDMLRGDLPMGMQLRKESKETALAPGGKADLLTLSALTPKGVTLEKPRSLRFVRYRLRPISRDLPPDDTVQSVRYEGANAAERTGIITVTVAPLPVGPTVPLFASPAAAPPRLRPFLASSLQISSDAPAFKTLAKKILGGETDAAKAAAKIAQFTHQFLTPDPAISSVRTALDIQRDPRGVCRDYTLYFTAIARAAGLPTRQRLGVVYADGRFFGHAWPEVWTGQENGSDRWTALEPTWGRPFADATHLCLAEGEITDFYTIMSDLSRYEITVEEAK